MMQLLDKPLRVAVLFDQQLFAGGGYQQALNAAVLLRDLPVDLVTPIFFTTLKANLATLKSYGIEAVFLDLGWFNQRRMDLRRMLFNPVLFKLLARIAPLNLFELFFAKYSIDLVYFLSPSPHAKDLETLNYIYTLWDLCHRDDPEFPEVSNYRVFERREHWLRSVLPKAVAILVESSTSKINCICRYGIDKSRLFVMPLSPARETVISSKDHHVSTLNIKEKYLLDCNYIFYPAQFWAHKNHVYLLQGLKILEQEFGYRIGAIFAGGDQGNLDYIQSIVDLLGLSNRVRFAGFVPNDEIPYLYKQALALVMPTYFGPTNLPPLEAFTLGVPVLYSNKVGLRDQVDSAALLMDLSDPRSMAAHLCALIEDPMLRTKLIAAGHDLVLQNKDTTRLATLTDIFLGFKVRRVCWQ